MNSSDYIIIYENISKKYNLKIIKNDEVNHINIEIDTFINNLTISNSKIKYNHIKTNTQNDQANIHDQSNLTDILYLSKRLLKFLLASDYIISSSIEYTKLHNQIKSMTDHYHFKNVKNTDNEIYNELKKIIQSSHIVKSKLITNFIKMYTSSHQEIKINL
jgi:hypothetical protein